MQFKICVDEFEFDVHSLNMFVCIHLHTHTDIHRHSENIKQTHTGYHPHKCKASTYYAVADMHGYKIEGNGVFLSDRILT